MSAAVERSVSRGREGTTFASSGRGGAGNIRQTSTSRDGASSTQQGPGPDDYSQSRGRELPASTNTTEQKVFSSGRGGAGNIRSPSRDATIESRAALREEAKYVREHVNVEAPVSHGRGGAGNISNSRSRSRSRDPTSTPGNPAAVLVGRGGFGNVKGGEESGTTLGRLAEEEDAKKAGEYRQKEQSEGQLHSTGRGGFANLFHRTSAEDKTTREKSRDQSRTRASGEYVSGGRGGSGNIHKA